MEIGDIVVYFIKVIAIQGVLFTFYWLALRHRPNHTLNRIFLLSTLLLSLVIPVIENPVPQRAEPMLDVVMLEWMSEPMEYVATEIAATSKTTSFPVWSVIGFIYFGLLILFLGRSSFHLYLLQKIKKQCEYVKKHWFKLFKTTQSRPFSFFSSVFIPKEIFGTHSFDQILAHECVHVRQLHSLDRLLVDFLVSLFWFNPFIYLYRNALIEVHEYQADAEVVKKYKDLVGYQEILFAQLQPAPYSGLVSHFNFSTIKKRIVMMNKSKNEGQSRLTYMLTLPLIAMALFAFTSKESTESVTHITDKIEALTGPFDVFPSVNSLSQEDKYRPSILPLRADADFKMTSSFGMRQDPIDMKKKQHKGIDLAAAIGTEVIATAEGIVEELSSNPNGHGHMITLNHGDKYKTRYSQLSEFKVENGDKVSKGQVIGLVGSSGRSSGPHLHYEVYEGDMAVDPLGFVKNYTFASLPKNQSTKVVISKVGPQGETVELEPNEEEVEIELENEVENEISIEAHLRRAEELKAEAVVQRAMAEENSERAIVEMRMAEAEAKEAAAQEQVAIVMRREAKVQEQEAREKAGEEGKQIQKIRIRDTGNKETPLFVVDGEVLKSGTLDELSPDRIESINVLKGKAAVEKYGNDGNNGVIEISTKGDKSKDKKKEKDKRKNN